MESAVVLLSGGQDSTTCLAWARARCEEVYSLSFDYGQRHRVELSAARRVARLAGVREHRVLPVSSLGELGGNELVDHAREAVSPTPSAGLPATFVPGRNLLFLTLAAAWAYRLGVVDLVIGAGEVDYSGYPDCREETLDKMAAALCAGLDAPVRVHAPLMHLGKADTVRLARDLEALDLLSYSHTCYNGRVPPCGLCAACRLRADGFAAAGIADPLLVRLAAG